MDDSRYVSKSANNAMIYRYIRSGEDVDTANDSGPIVDPVIKDTRRFRRGDGKVHIKTTDEFIEDYVDYLTSDDDSYVQYYIGSSAPLFIHATYVIRDQDFFSMMTEYISELNRCLKDLHIPEDFRFAMVYTIGDSSTTAGTVQHSDDENAIADDDDFGDLEDDNRNEATTKFLIICPFVGAEYRNTVMNTSNKLKDLNENMELESGDCPLLNKNMTLTYITNSGALVRQWSPSFDDVEKQLKYFLDEGRITVCAEDGHRIAEEMIKILKTDSYNHFLDSTDIFINVGKILHNLYRRTDDKGLSIWMEIAGIDENNPSCTVEGQQYTEENLEDLLNEFAVDNHLTHKTLMWYARQLEYHKYREWQERWMREGVIFHKDDYRGLAELFFKMYPDNFIHDGGHKWYYYKEGMWMLDSKQVQLKYLINGEFVAYIRDRLIPNYVERKISESIISDLKTVVKALPKSNNKSNLIEAICYYYMDNQLSSKLDANKFLLNTANCLIDFSNNSARNTKVHIRDPMPEDFITKRIPVGYNRKLHMGHKKIKMIQDFLAKVFPDEETRLRSCIIFASFLVGGNKDKKIYIMSGPKDSSKSTFKAIFMDKVLNNDTDGYARDAPIEALIRGNKNSSQASPELAQAKNCKVVTFTEPEKGVTFEASLIKRITGGDSTFGRGLYENGGSIRSTFKYIIQCNTIPVLKQYDKPALDRFFIIPFLSKFTDDAPESEAEQWAKRIFPKDDTIQDNTGKYAEALFWYILQFIPRYFEEGIQASQEMRRVLKEYLARNDIYSEFVQNELVRREDALMDPARLVKMYREWHYNTRGTRVYLDNGEIQRELLERLETEVTLVNGRRVIQGYAFTPNTDL